MQVIRSTPQIAQQLVQVYHNRSRWWIMMIDFWSQSQSWWCDVINLKSRHLTPSSTKNCRPVATFFAGKYNVNLQNLTWGKTKSCLLFCYCLQAHTPTTKLILISFITFLRWSNNWQLTGAAINYTSNLNVCTIDNNGNRRQAEILQELYNFRKENAWKNALTIRFGRSQDAMSPFLFLS